MINSVSVKDFGAIGDGVANDGAAFQAALDSNSDIVTIPVGEYKIAQTLYISSNTKIMAHPRAVIKLADNTLKKRGDFLITNKHYLGEGDENIAIYGGVWDGNNKTNHKPLDRFYDDTAPSGAIMNFKSVKNLTLSGLTLSDSGGYYTRFCRVNGFLFENITFRSLNNSNNNDGLHIGGFCENGVIRNIVAHTPGTPSDDMIALNADDIITRCEALDIDNGYIRNIVIDGLYAESCMSFVRILSIYSDISNITISNVKGGFYGMFVNMDAARYCMTPIVSPDSPEYRRGVGYVRNVSINHAQVHCTNPWPDGSYMRLESNMENFSINDFKRDTHLERTHGPKSLRILNISPSKIQVTGLEEKEAKEFVKGVANAELAEHTDRYGNTKTSADITTDYYEELVLERGGFDSLTINKI